MLAIMLANSRRGPPPRLGSGHKFASPRSVRPPFSLIGHPPPASPPMRWRHHQRRPLSSFMGPPPRPPRWSRRCAPDRTWRTCGSSTSTPMATGATQESAADGLHSRRRALPGGKPIITLFSRAMGQQGLASRHPPATRVGMVSTRGDVHGGHHRIRAVNLHGETLRERGEALVSIARPDFCAELLRDLAQIRHFTLSQG